MNSTAPPRTLSLASSSKATNSHSRLKSWSKRRDRLGYSTAAIVNSSRTDEVNSSGRLYTLGGVHSTNSGGAAPQASLQHSPIQSGATLEFLDNNNRKLTSCTRTVCPCTLVIPAPDRTKRIQTLTYRTATQALPCTLSGSCHPSIHYCTYCTQAQTDHTPHTSSLPLLLRSSPVPAEASIGFKPKSHLPAVRCLSRVSCQPFTCQPYRGSLVLTVRYLRTRHAATAAGISALHCDCLLHGPGPVTRSPTISHVYHGYHSAHWHAAVLLLLLLLVAARTRMRMRNLLVRTHTLCEISINAA
ncbi:hypothetical protein BDW22DRAFT_902637 [Trametopsis cervina]|nr:hypothetical protein BDW22DRAFT_902637 [Trametopsis cervina]